MNETIGPPPSYLVRSDGVCAIYSEVWRLEQLAEALLDRIQSASARRIARQIRAALAEIDLEIIDYVGRPYDPGMAPEVLDVQLIDGAMEAGDIVSETIEPTLVWRGQVLRQGQIVVQRVVVPRGDEGERP